MYWVRILGFILLLGFTTDCASTAYSSAKRSYRKRKGKKIGRNRPCCPNKK
ncbi:MAG: hypothetical protein OXB93_03630 [Cytophagales bacterium]|nr:hypothetical protein [Cytophagales bacterium]